MSLLDVTVKQPIDYNAESASDLSYRERLPKDISHDVLTELSDRVLPGISWEALASNTRERSALLVYLLGLLTEKFDVKPIREKKWHLPIFEADWLCAGTSLYQNIPLQQSTEGSTTWISSEERHIAQSEGVMIDEPLMGVPLKSYKAKFTLTYKGKGQSILQDDTEIEL